nr:hypothetical protein [Tanacetum cinerariifolium]GEZ55399.1 hypothetical protein [Tanacetum cinerariifolium]
MNALSFYKMEIDEISEWYIEPCFVNGLEAYDGEINLAFDENLISNEFAIKLCLDYEINKGKKLVKKELIVALRGELYVVKFIINLKEVNFEHGVILGRSFMRLAKGVVDFDKGFREELPPFECKMGKSHRNKKRAIENLNLFYQDIGPSSLAGDHLTQEEAEKKALKDKVELYGKTVKEEEDIVKRIKGEALKEKDDPGVFIFPIRLEGKLHEHMTEKPKSRSKPPRQHKKVEELLLPPVHYEFLLWEGCSREAKSRTTGYDKIQKNNLWLLSMFDAGHQNKYANVAWVIAKWMKRKGAGTQKESQICYGQFISKLARKCRVLTKDVVRSLTAPIYCRDVDTTTLRDLIDSDGKLIREDPQPGVPRVSIPRPPRASMEPTTHLAMLCHSMTSTISSTSLCHYSIRKTQDELARRKDSEY